MATLEDEIRHDRFPFPARGTPVGTPLLRSDPSAVPQASERDLGSLREFLYSAGWCSSSDQ